MIFRTFLLVTVAVAGLQAAGSSCDRACLQGVVDSYLDAMAKHDPSNLPVAPSVRFTENGKELKLGEVAVAGVRHSARVGAELGNDIVIEVRHVFSFVGLMSLCSLERT